MLSSVAVGLAILSTAAFAAADSGNHDWTGPYAGANLGAGMSNGAITDPDCTTCGADTFSERLLQGGLDAGYNKQFKNTVLGLEGEIDYGSQNHRNDMRSLDADGGASLTSSNISWTAALLGRAGVGVGDSLLFLEAGPALAHLSGTVDSATTVAAVSVWQPGFKAAGGIEFMATDNVSIRIQYSELSVGNRVAYENPASLAGTGRFIWTNSQSVASIGAAWHF
jgi:opacity protein-like surface antigen